MKKLWKGITETGIEQGTAGQLAKKVRITNQVVAAISAIAFLYIFIFYFAGFKREGLEVIGGCCLLAAPLLLNRYRKYMAAKVWFVVALNSVVYLYAWIFGRHCGIQLVYFLCTFIPWMIFELRNWKYIAASTIIAFSCYFTYHFSNVVPLVSVSPGIQGFIFSCIVLTVFGCIVFCMQFLVAQNHRSEKSLYFTYKQFFEDIPTPMWILDDETLEFLAVNKFAIEKYGYSKEEFMEMRVPDIRTEEDKKVAENFIKDKIKTNSLDAGYMRHKKKNGEMFYVHILSNATVYNGRSARVVLAVDVNDKVLTEKKNAELNVTLTKANEQLQISKESLEAQEEELRQINEELTQQTEELKASEEELKTQEEELRQVNYEMNEKNDALELAAQALVLKAEELDVASKYKSEFLANMSHELRTPLNSIMILANLLKENKPQTLNNKQMEYAGIIHKSGSDLLKLINDILDLSKIEAGKVDIFSERVKIKDIAYDLEMLFTVLANDKKIDFVIAIGDDVPETINTDRQRIAQVIKNLLSNAFKFTPANGRVTLAFSLNDAALAISVADTGIGIPAEKQQLIFEAFQQADGSTSRRFGGTGLGLSISKELVKRLNGVMAMSSETGMGSIFTIFLPLNESAGSITLKIPSTYTPALSPLYKPEKVKQQTVVADDKHELKPGEPSLLIIEDDAIFAAHVKNFANRNGYKTIIAISGDEGIFYAKKYRPVAIILDLGLPVIDGRNVLNILKTDDGLKHIPVHVVTADDRMDIPAGSVENYLQKPLNTHDLEKTFADITSYIKEHYRNILIVSAQSEAVKAVTTALIEKYKEITFVAVNSLHEATAVLKEENFDCIIADIGADIQAGVPAIEQLKNTAAAGTYIITGLDSDISTNDEKQLRKYSDSIIRKSTHSRDRLMDELELFLNKVKYPQAISVPADYHKEFDKSLRGKKVLLADDDMRNVFALTALLEEQGMKVVAAEHGIEALDLLERNSDVAIVLMDIMMPEMDGYETMRHIRANERHRDLPILALTAKAMAGDKEKCIAAGASDYITKPVDNNKLFSLMRVWLSQ